MANSTFAKLNRESTKITISEFYERNQLNKYNFEPEYQRRGDVWSEEKQSFLIDSILKNYPMPPKTFTAIIDYLSKLQIEYEKYKINGVSHFYALFAFSYKCLSLDCDYKSISARINEFFNKLRGSGDVCSEVREYKESMQSNTRSKGQRIKRIHALTKYCGLDE